MPRGRVLKWFTTLRNLQAIADNSFQTFNLLEDMSVADEEGSTVTRILLEMWAYNDTANNAKTMDWGIVFVNSDAVAVSAFPDADDEDERVDWLGRGRLFVITDTLNKGEAVSHAMYDLRAQRIHRVENEQLRLVCDLDLNGTGGIWLTFIARVLMRMP